MGSWQPGENLPSEQGLKLVKHHGKGGALDPGENLPSEQGLKLDRDEVEARIDSR